MMKRLVFRSLLAVTTLLTALCFLIATSRPAYGYVDPGTGFLAVQTFASVAAAFGYFLRRRIAQLFSGKKSDTLDIAKPTPTAK